jgi:hypothetical protein
MTHFSPVAEALFMLRFHGRSAKDPLDELDTGQTPVSIAAGCCQEVPVTFLYPVKGATNWLGIILTRYSRR